MSNQSPNHLFSNFCALSHTEANRIHYKWGRPRPTLNLYTQPFRVPLMITTVLFWPGHTQMSCWNTNLQDGTRGRGLCVVTWVEPTWLEPVSLQQRVQREQWALPVDDLDFGPPPCIVVRIKYLLLISHSLVYLTTASYLQKDSGSLANWKPAAIHSLAFSRLHHRTWDQMACARTTARNSQIPGRETPGQAWVRAAFSSPLSFFQDLSMGFTSPWTHNHPASVSQVQRSQAHTTTPDLGNSTWLM